MFDSVPGSHQLAASFFLCLQASAASYSHQDALRSVGEYSRYANLANYFYSIFNKLNAQQLAHVQFSQSRTSAYRKEA